MARMTVAMERADFIGLPLTPALSRKRERGRYPSPVYGRRWREAPDEGTRRLKDKDDGAKHEGRIAVESAVAVVRRGGGDHCLGRLDRAWPDRLGQRGGRPAGGF